MKVQASRDKTEAVKLTKTITQKEQEGVRNFTAMKTYEALISDTSVKAMKRKIDI